MNPLEELTNAIRLAQNNALAQNIAPVVIIGLFEIFKNDLYSSMAAAAKAQAENKIIPVNRMPPNGHQH